jgi:hypothetical protein
VAALLVLRIMEAKARRALLVLLLALLCLAAEAQYPPTNKKAKAPAVKTDIPCVPTRRPVQLPPPCLN